MGRRVARIGGVVSSEPDILFVRNPKAHIGASPDGLLKHPDTARFVEITLTDTGQFLWRDRHNDAYRFISESEALKHFDDCSADWSIAAFRKIAALILNKIHERPQ